MRDFKYKYDVVQLIECVRDRPCLWDKSFESYKDRLERRTAWEQIFRILEENYDDLSREEQKITGELILTKWRIIRDSFVRALRTQGGKYKKPYVLHKHLTFLLKVVPEYNEYVRDDTRIESESEPETLPTPPKRKYYDEDSDDYDVTYDKKTKKMFKFDILGNEDTGIDFDQVNDLQSESSRFQDQDETFFASLLPAVTNYNEDERLEFRIEVLSVMKKIKDQRKQIDRRTSD